MRRKPGRLVPLEREICKAALELKSRAVNEFHGYELAKCLSEVTDRRLLTAYGTLYRALGRLEKMGLLQSRPEDPHIAARERRPARRLYTLTALDEIVTSEALAAVPEKTAPRARRRLVPA